MTRIDFYTHVEDKVQTICKLSMKAVSAGMRLMILTENKDAGRDIDEALWQYPATGFIPHCMADDPLAPETPVVISEKEDALLHDDILLNLKAESPIAFSRFQRLIEIVGTDPEEALAARSRFKFYKDRGYEIHHHNLSKRGS